MISITHTHGSGTESEASGFLTIISAKLSVSEKRRCGNWRILMKRVRCGWKLSSSVTREISFP